MGRRSAARTFPVTSGTLTLRQDPDAADAWVVDVNGTRQSHVDLGDPARLSFAYMRRIGHVLDLVAPPRSPIDAVHLGGGGLTLPRYVAATRPRSRQRVFEIDPLLTQVVREELPLERDWQIRVRPVDALDGLEGLRDASADVVVVDVFRRGRTPDHLLTVAVAEQASRVLRPSGVCILNLIDRPPLTMARRQVANLSTCWPHVCALAEVPTLNGRGSGNIVLVAAARPLPLDELRARAAGDRDPARVVSGRALQQLLAGARPVPAGRQPAGSA